MSTKKVSFINKKAFHDYTIIRKLEAGIVLTGTEVKSIKHGNLQIKSSWIDVDDNDEVQLHDVYIGHYTHGNIFNHEVRRTRKLLLHKRQILQLKKDMTTASMTIVPLKIYQKKYNIKCELALVKGKKNYDKRRALQEKQEKLELARQLKNKE